MQCVIMKTGLDAFDIARVWGLASLLAESTRDAVLVRDDGFQFRVESFSDMRHDEHWTAPSLPPGIEENWPYVFITSKKEERKQKIKKIEEQFNMLKRNRDLLLEKFGVGDTSPIFVKQGETLPGALDPAAFKGVRQVTRARYAEDQLKVDLDHWTLACVGAALCGTYQRVQSAGAQRTLVLLPVPFEVTVYQYEELQELTRWTDRSRHISSATAAAHAAVRIAERVRKRAAAMGGQLDRFSEIVFFELFHTGNQPKPAQGNRVRLDRLMEMVQNELSDVERMFSWLDYCFRRGTVKGFEELALAATDLVFSWNLDSYYRLARVFLRLLMTNEIRAENRPDEEALKGVLAYVTAQ